MLSFTPKFQICSFISSMDDQIKETIKNNQHAISPVFPEPIDYEALMNNKFER